MRYSGSRSGRRAMGALAALLAIGGCAQARPAGTPAATASARPVLPVRAEVLAAMERVADWQLAHRSDLSYMPEAKPSAANPLDWQQATFWIALTELADRSADPRFGRAIIDLGRAQGWRLGARSYHADDHLIGQAWIWASRHGAGVEAIAPTRAGFDRIIARPSMAGLEFVAKAPGGGEPDCVQRWCWCDALFMAPPTLFALAGATGDGRYADFAHREFVAATDYLYSPAEHLYFRDSRFFDRRDANGAGLFWSRGNGWVMGGLVRILAQMASDDPRRGYYENLFREMAARVRTLQRADGYWAASLLGDREAAPPEASGTGFFVYALAWGVKNGLLSREDHEPAIIRGWAAMMRAIQPDGRLGWVQQVGDRPDHVRAHDTQFYGTGAFLLAGSAVYDLVGERP
ncbi:MAG: glycoside hydrolase family 88 protein [Sphingomonas sp.]|nr:glycoside hydrolase family 88 protein [Sphingomonas sp.]MDX3885076.1 glycoside hydrolase family 88 protein [Sphingomonas sp.]